MINKQTFVKLFLAFIFMSGIVSAQRITKIKFDGLAHFSTSVAKQISGLHVGDQMDANKINHSIKNFFNKGYFGDVWVEQKGGVLIYHFKEKVAIANIEIKGYGTNDDSKKLLKSLGLRKGDLYDTKRTSEAKERLITTLEQKGYYDTVIEIETEPVGTSSISVVFNVNKGEKVVIKKINFIGASALSQSDLERELANKEKDILGWMPWRNNGEASIEQLEFDAYRIKNAYMQHGYLDATVGQPLMRVDFGSYSAEVDYQISEGVQYRLGRVEVVQQITGLDSKYLKELLTLKEGKIFNVKRMRKDMEILKEEAGNLGYAFVRIDPQMHQDAKTKTVNLQYVIHAGVPVKVNDVIISGNDSTKDRVIRRYIYLAPGDTFNARDLKDSKGALGRTGFFEKVNIESERISADKINLLVNVKETSTGSISLGGGYGSFEGVMVNASYGEKNTFGSGITTNVGFEVSKVSKNYNISFTNPKVWDSKYSLGVSLYKKEYQYYNFTQDQLGGSVILGREFWRYYHASVGVGYADNQSRENDNNNAFALDANSTLDLSRFTVFNDRYSKTSLYASLSFDNTDDFYVPRSGMVAAVNLEYASLKGSDYNNSIGSGEENGYGDLMRVSTKFGIYYGLEDWIDYDLILRFKSRTTIISNGSNEKLPIGEKLFMGGAGSVRGYNPYSLSPLSKTSSLFGTGGKKRASVSFEASIPLSIENKMRITGFYDYGMIGENDFTEIKRSSAGVALEWQSPFGPLNLIFAKALDDKPEDQTAVFEFSMGAKF